MNCLNTKGIKKGDFNGHFYTLTNVYDWIAIAVRCPQVYPQRAHYSTLFDMEGKCYWNGNVVE